jgi:sensor histidine kinase YesM
MNMQDFIFSDKRSHRITRHLAFLSILGTVFFLQSVVPGIRIYKTAFFSLCCFFPTCILSVYVCLYFLLPFLLQQKRYGRFLLAFILMAISFLVINYFTAGLFLILARDFSEASHTPSVQMGLSFVNTSHAMIIGGLALGIKFAKNWYLRHKENSVLARQKIITELQLEKARIYPRFLFQSLDNLRTRITTGSADASALLLKVSDLLSYILYENNEKWVPLEKELGMMQNLIDIEKTSRAKNLNIEVYVSGEQDNKYIIPMTLFLLLEDCFKALENKRSDRPRINLDIKIKSNELLATLAISKGAKGNNGASNWYHTFQNTSQRLDALYQGNFRLEMKEEKQAFIVLLHVFIKNNIAEANSDFSKELKQPVYENP